MSNFPLHTLMSAPGGSKPFLARARKRRGRVPNLIAELAESPQAIEAYFALDAAFERSELSSIERQIVLLAASVEQQCHYCTAVHALEAREAGADLEMIKKVRAGEAIEDPRLEAVRTFATMLVRNRGAGGHAQAERLIGLGFARASLLDIVIAVAQSTISTYVNHFAETPLDEWLKPWRA